MKASRAVRGALACFGFCFLSVNCALGPAHAAQQRQASPLLAIHSVCVLTEKTQVFASLVPVLECLGRSLCKAVSFLSFTFNVTS